MKNKIYNPLICLVKLNAFIFLLSGILTGTKAQEHIRPAFPVSERIEVNSYNGNMIYTRHDVLIKGNMPISISFYYNSVTDSVDMGYGAGWYFNYGLHYRYDTANNIILVRNGGREDLYTKQGAQYLPPTGIYDQLQEYEPNKFKLRTKAGIEYFFANPAHKKLTGINDLNGNYINISYAQGFPVTIANSSGRSVSLSWTGGRLSGVTYEGSSFHYAYAGAHLSEVVNPQGYSETYQYLPTGKLAAIKDYNNNPVYFEYSGGVLINRIKTCISEIGFSFVENKSYVLENRNEGKKITCYTYDDLGRLVAITNPLQKSIHFQYDENNNVQRFTDFRGYHYHFTYDAQGNILSVIDPAGNAVYLSYNEQNRITDFIDQKGNTNQFTYDESGNLISLAQPLNVTTNSEYDTKGNLSHFHDALGNTTLIAWDNNDNISQITFPIGSIALGYNDAGNIIQFTDGNGNDFFFEYADCNTCSLLSKFMINDTIATTYTYDGNYNLVSETDANGNIIIYGYDELNRLNSVSLPAGTTAYKYDQQGNLTTITNANGNTTNLDYNEMGLLSSAIDAIGRKNNYEYDVNGNLVKEFTANGDVITYAYNAMNQLVQRSYPGNTDHFSYDVLGNLVNVYNNDISLSYTYDALGRLTSKSVDTWKKTISYTYDAAGNRKTMTDPDGGITYYDYDAMHRFLALENPFGEITTFEYDPGGRITRQNNANGTYTEYLYTDWDWLLSLSNKKSNGEIISKYDYSYDRHGNRLTMTVNDTAVHYYTYDASHQLIEVVYPWGETESFTYDGFGNRLSRTLNGEVTHYTYNEADQLLTAGDAVFTFDYNGNMTSKMENGETTVYVYNALNRLVKIVFPDGTENAFTYDPFGNRISLTNKSGQTNFFLIDGDNLLKELDHEGNTQAHYTSYLMVDSWISLHRNNQSYHYHMDALNSTTSLTNSNQVIKAEYIYRAFGQIEYLFSEVFNPFTFTGREYDIEANKYYYRSRYYNQQYGMFISVDPLAMGLMVGLIQKYVYAENNPISYIDPYGLISATLRSYRKDSRQQSRIANEVTPSFWYYWFTEGIFTTHSGLQKSSSFLACILEELLSISGSKFVKPLKWIDFAKNVSRFNSKNKNRRVAFQIVSRKISGEAAGAIGTKIGFAIGLKFGLVGAIPGSIIGHTLGKCLAEPLGDDLGGFIYDKLPAPPDIPPINIPVIQPIDPNEILGPPGYDTLQWIAASQNLAYTVLFENDPDFATAPAQNVLIKVPVTANINMYDFRLSSFGFGSFVFEVPANKASHYTRLDVRDSLGLYVDFTAGVNVNTQETFWLFESIDPATGLPPQEAQAGFLPVNDSLARGEGFVNFTIKPKATCQTGDLVTAQAEIFFDDEAPIETNIWVNKVDALTPVSSIANITQVSANAYNISFIGQDDPGGCGINTIALYAAKDDEPYLFYGEVKADSTLRFTAADGASYRMFSIAKDYVGNTEAMKMEPDTVVILESAVYAGPDAYVCVGESYHLEHAYSELPLNQWTTGGDGVFNNTFEVNAIYTPGNNDKINGQVQLCLHGTASLFMPVVSDCMVLSILQLPAVNCPADFAVSISQPPFMLQGAVPTGGIYSGPGVSNNNFDPVTAGLGVHEIEYSYTDSNGCTGMCSFLITVEFTDYDFGDAPEVVLAYPGTGVIGHFPTCYGAGPELSFIRHGANPGLFFGPSVDYESDGNAGFCQIFSFYLYNQDVGFQDGDAGLIMPAPYTIIGIPGTETVVPYIPDSPILWETCRRVTWGADIDIHIENQTGQQAWFNLLVDWNQDGMWAGSSGCSNGYTVNEHAVVNFPVPDGFSGPLSLLSPPEFRVGPVAGYAWSRFTLTEQPVNIPWDGSGTFSYGETEDYLIAVAHSTGMDQDILVDGHNFNPGHYDCIEAEAIIEMSNTTLSTGTNLALIAGEKIRILPGTYIQHGTQFLARIDYGQGYCNYVRSLNTEPAYINFGFIATGACNTQLYQLTGEYLDEDVMVFAPAGFLVSTQPNSGFSPMVTISPENGTVDKNIYVRFCPVMQQQYEGTITNTTPDNIAANVLINGHGKNIPQSIAPPSVVIQSGEDVCYEAMQTIVTGTPYFIVMPGGSAKLVAGQKITLKPITEVRQGGYLHAYIETEGKFCFQPVGMLASEEQQPTEFDVIESPELEVSFFKLYPNPTPGIFTLEIFDTTSSSDLMVEIFTIMGERILLKELAGSKYHHFDLSEMVRGIYLVRVIRGDEMGIEKVIRQ